MPNAITILAAVGYALIAALLIARRASHYEIAILGMQCAVMLPALVFAIRKSPSGSAAVPWRSLARAALAVFAIYCTILSWWLYQGQVISDESSYLFQARILASGRMVAPPPPGAAVVATDAASTVRFNHDIAAPSGWYSKYPLGWPAALSIPERLGVGWLVAPLLGIALILLIRRIAAEVFDDTTADAAVVFIALAPPFQAYCAGKLSHALAGLLIAGATLLCLRGVRTLKLSRFVAMFTLLAVSFHVRPFTAFVAAAVLGSASLWMLRDNRSMLLRTALVAAFAAVVSAGSVLAYNRAFTGDPFLSPYAAYRGTSVPVEILATPVTMVKNAMVMLRWSVQSVSVYSFPFFLPLAMLGYWMWRKRSWGVTLLAVLFSAMALAHLVQTEVSSSYVGERYWFEVYFAAAILAAAWIVARTPEWRLSRSTVHTLCAILFIVQGALMLAAATLLAGESEPERRMRQFVSQFEQCDCVIFLGSTPPVLYGEQLNLNRPNWPGRRVFYAVDPGEAERDKWTIRFGQPGWIAVAFNTANGAPEIVGRGSAQ
jgi:hypothetical protein